MLEVVADTVYSNDGKSREPGRRNEHVLRRLLEQLHTTMAIYHVWGSPFLGGGHLFKQHRETRQKITGFVEKMQVMSPAKMINHRGKQITVLNRYSIKPKTNR